MLLRPFKSNPKVILQELDIADLKLTVEGLSKLFTKFLYKHYTNSPDIILTMFITHLRYHYEQPMILEHLYSIRLLVRKYNILYYFIYNVYSLDENLCLLKVLYTN